MNSGSLLGSTVAKSAEVAVCPPGQHMHARSIATDLGTGQPLDHALRTAILAVRLGELAGRSPPELVDAYYISLLHSFGCTSDATEQTALFGDDIELRAKFALVEGGNPDEVGAFLIDVVGQGRPPEGEIALLPTKPTARVGNGSRDRAATAPSFRACIKKTVKRTERLYGISHSGR
jgi:hypothetical protein